jgi:CheY-like chemotaxis protein
MTLDRSRTKDPDHGPKRPRVLLADDDEDVRYCLAQMLDYDGYDVTEVTDGAALLAALSPWILDPSGEPPADVIVTDVRMPGVDGLSLVEGLRAHHWPGPIVLMSAYADDELREQVDRLPNVRFLPKPFHLEVLRSTLENLEAAA